MTDSMKWILAILGLVLLIGGRPMVAQTPTDSLLITQDTIAGAKVKVTLYNVQSNDELDVGVRCKGGRLTAFVYSENHDLNYTSDSTKKRIVVSAHAGAYLTRSAWVVLGGRAAWLANESEVWDFVNAWAQTEKMAVRTELADYGTATQIVPLLHPEKLMLVLEGCFGKQPASVSQPQQ